MGQCLRHPVMPCWRKRLTTFSSVLLFPLDLIRDIQERLALSRVSSIGFPVKLSPVVGSIEILIALAEHLRLRQVFRCKRSGESAERGVNKDL